MPFANQATHSRASAPRGAALVPLMKTRWAGAPSGSWILPNRWRLGARSNGSWRTTMPCAGGWGSPRWPPTPSMDSSKASQRAYCLTWTRCGRCSTENGARAGASCSRGHRERCSTSTTGPILSSPPRIRLPRRPRPVRGSAPGPSTMCSASARPIRRGWGRGRSRPSSEMSSAD